jgi:transposase
MRGHAISNDLKMAAVRMSRVLPVKLVAVLLDISADSVRRSVKNYEEFGEVHAPQSGKARGRKRILDESDLAVSI